MVQYNIELQFRIGDEGNSTNDSGIYAKIDENEHGKERKQQSDDE